MNGEFLGVFCINACIRMGKETKPQYMIYLKPRHFFMEQLLRTDAPRKHRVSCIEHMPRSIWLEKADMIWSFIKERTADIRAGYNNIWAIVIVEVYMSYVAMIK